MIALPWVRTRTAAVLAERRETETKAAFARGNAQIEAWRKRAEFAEREVHSLEQLVALERELRGKALDHCTHLGTILEKLHAECPKRVPDDAAQPVQKLYNEWVALGKLERAVREVYYGAMNGGRLRVAGDLKAAFEQAGVAL